MTLTHAGLSFYKVQVILSSRGWHQPSILIIYPDRFTPLMVRQTNVKMSAFKPMEIYGNVFNCVRYYVPRKVLPRKMRLFNIAYNVCTYLGYTLREDQFISTKWRSIRSLIPWRPYAQFTGCTKCNQCIYTICMALICIFPQIWFHIIIFGQ